MYFEEEGIATSVIGLVRLHLEKVKPPRALWVPFELGRPLGQPNNPEFQKKVLRAALQLLVKPQSGPNVLMDFPDDEPGIEGDENWQAPVRGADSLLDEVRCLLPSYERSKAKFGRTTVGLSGLSIETAAEYLMCFAGDDAMASPDADVSALALLRFAIDDLKAFYMEAACADNSRPSSRQLMDWFWNGTLAAQKIRDLRELCLASDDGKYQLVGNTLVPRVRL